MKRASCRILIAAAAMLCLPPESDSRIDVVIDAAGFAAA